MSWKCSTCGLINHDLNRACPSCNTPTIKDIFEESRKIDESIKLRQDLFNASTVAIIELFKAVDADPSIELNKKQFKKAELLFERFKHIKEVVFKKRAELIEEENTLRAVQTHLNELANRLHEAERIELKLENVNYDPSIPKSIKPQSVSKTTKSSNKYSKEEINQAANKYSLPALAIQMTCVARSVSPDEAGRIITESKQKVSNS